MSKVKQADIDRLIDCWRARQHRHGEPLHYSPALCAPPARERRPKEIEQLPMVKGCFTNAGQFQVVIGTEVGDYYNALLETTGKAYADKEQAKKPLART